MSAHVTAERADTQLRAFWAMESPPERQRTGSNWKDACNAQQHRASSDWWQLHSHRFTLGGVQEQAGGVSKHGMDATKAMLPNGKGGMEICSEVFCTVHATACDRGTAPSNSSNGGSAFPYRKGGKTARRPLERSLTGSSLSSSRTIHRDAPDRLFKEARNESWVERTSPNRRYSRERTRSRTTEAAGKCVKHKAGSSGVSEVVEAYPKLRHTDHIHHVLQKRGCIR